MQFKVKDVPGAGNCLFEAVGRTIQIEASQLRQYVVDYIHQPNQTLYKEPLEMWIKNSDIPSQTVQEYIEYIQRQGTWGGGMELAILSTILKRPILVYAIEKNPNEANQIAEFLPDQIQDYQNLIPICILYVGRSHYMQLLFENKL